MVKPILCVDFDDVIADFDKAYIPHHNHFYGTDKRYEDQYTFDLPTFWELDATTISVRIRHFCLEHHDEITMVPGAAQVLRELAKSYRLILLTSRCESLRRVTEDWLVRHGIAFEECYFDCGYGSLFPERSRGKAAMCAHFEAEALIEDAPHNVEQVADSGVKVLAFDRPWNQGIAGKNIVRVHDWKQDVRGSLLIAA